MIILSRLHSEVNCEKSCCIIRRLTANRLPHLLCEIRIIRVGSRLPTLSQKDCVGVYFSVTVYIIVSCHIATCSDTFLLFSKGLLQMKRIILSAQHCFVYTSPLFRPWTDGDGNSTMHFSVAISAPFLRCHRATDTRECCYTPAVQT